MLLALLLSAWIDETGRQVQLDAWKGRPALVTTFFRSCPLQCPRTIDRLRRIEKEAQGRGAPLEIVLITLDPASDTPPRLEEFKRRQHLSVHWHFLAGSREETVTFCREHFGWIPLYDGEHVDHGTGFLLLDKAGRQVLEGKNLQEETLARLLSGM